MTKLSAISAFLCATLWVNSAYASICILGICLGGGGSGGDVSPAPELDGPGSLSAIALVVCIGAIAYRHLYRR